MTEQEQREAARQFYYKWKDKGQEDEDGRSYWIDLLNNVFGVDDVTDRVSFEKKVPGADGNTKRIDVYIPETKVLIEQKSLGIALDKPQIGHDGKTPYEQAKEYDNGLPYDEKSRWIITCNFAEIWIYDMNQNQKKLEPVKITLSDLQEKFHLLDFLVNRKQKKISEEIQLSIKAGELVGKIHDRFLEQYNDPLAKRTQNSLNILCVRLVFCLYAENAGLFGAHNAFSKYIEECEPKNIRRALLDLFKVLDTPLDQRADLYLDEELAAFPYVNGGLFARENIEIPLITQDIKDTLLEAAEFDWAKISPAIFGAVFESTLNPETRRSGGMHYTSIENIHKVIDPLFLDDLKMELAEIEKIPVFNIRKKKLQAFQNKLASLTFLDPAAGSGNFLTETYLCLRRLENKAIAGIGKGNLTMGLEDTNNPIKVSILQFYGIEINDFAVSVARTALWIAESQMFQETESIVYGMNDEFLPLKTNANIIEGNALQLDWERIVPKDKSSYIMGNPPFVGYKMQNADQKRDLQPLLGDVKNVDYVAGWYYKASQLIKGTNIRCCFISTNSIVQGEQVALIWKGLFEKYNIHFDFAYRSFLWGSEASEQAKVHVAIIGFSTSSDKKKFIVNEDGNKHYVSHINGYLVDADDVYIERRVHPLCQCSEMISGSEARDGGFLILSESEKNELLAETPDAVQYIRRYESSEDFINSKIRYCLWFKGQSMAVAKRSKIIMSRLDGCRQFRENSKQQQAHKMADLPAYFVSERQPETEYIAFPVVSSRRRRYVPIGFLDPSIVVSNKIVIIPGATLYDFGILTSNVHMAWMRAVCVRLRMDYSYSNLIVYNNFPWPSPSDEQKKQIEMTAQEILGARKLYPNSSFADLYDPLTMPPELRKAHQKNDAAVMKAYGFDVKTMSEADCVAALMKMYQELVSKADGGKA